MILKVGFALSPDINPAADALALSDILGDNDASLDPLLFRSSSREPASAVVDCKLIFDESDELTAITLVSECADGGIL